MIVLVSHGKLASGMKSAVEIIMGTRNDLYAIDAYMDGEDNLLDSIQKFIDEFKHEKIIFISDLLGGSINNLLLNQLDFRKYHLVTGMHLSLILELLAINLEEYSDSQIVELLSHVTNMSKKTIIYNHIESLHFEFNEDDF